MFKTFSGGIHLPEYKELTSKKITTEAVLPPEVVLPLIQHIGAGCEPRVKAGDKVYTGTCVAESQEFVSAPIHAGISGEVTAVTSVPHPILGRCPGIIIKSDGRDEKDPAITKAGDISAISADAIKAKVRAAGIVGLGGAAFPTHVKLSPQKKVDTFLLNGAECEPYLTCDHRLMLENPREIILGMRLLVKALNLNQGYIAIENNKPDAITKMQDALKEAVDQNCRIDIVRLKVKYPQGAEKQLIKSVLNREIPSNGLPYDVGVMVNNVATAYAVYEAVYLNKPLYERVVTVSGSCVKEPKNLRARIGTRFSHLVEQCGGTTCPAMKVIMGGPMMGLAQETLDVPVIKGTSGILLFNQEDARIYKDSQCLRCGKCLEYCPMRLMPNMIASCVEYKKYDKLSEYYPLDCIECGICAYVCGAKRPLVQLIRRAKLEMRKKK